MQVKMFKSSDLGTLEYSINDWLKSTPEVDVIEYRYQVIVTDKGKMQYSASLLYR